MRPLLITATAVALVASMAAAANFDVNDADATLDDASTASAAVEDCTDGLHLDLVHSQEYDETINDWHVTGVRVAAAGHDLDADPVNLLDTCLDLALSVAIDDQSANHIVLGPVVLDADTVTDGIIELPVPDGTLIAVRDVHETSALVELDPALLVPPALIRVTGSHGDVIAEVLDRDGSNTPTVGDTIVLGAMPLELDWSSSTSAAAGQYEVTAVFDQPNYVRLGAGTRYIDFEFDGSYGLDGNHVDFVGFQGCYFHLGHSASSTTLFIFDNPSCAHARTRNGPSSAGPIASVDYAYRD